MEQVKAHYIEHLKTALKSIDVTQWGNSSTTVIFGAGNTSRLYQKSFQLENIIPAFYADNDVKKQGTFFNGVKVISPVEITALDNPFVLICSQNMSMVSEIKIQLEKMGLSYMTVDEYIFAKNADKLVQVIEMLEDEYSIATYYNAVVARFTNSKILSEFISDQQYFALPQFKQIDGNEVFVDMGAFCGETIEEYLFKRSGTFKKIVAFEPAERNFTAMQCRVKRLKGEWALDDDKIVCVRGGVGKKNSRVKFNSNQIGMGSRDACFSDQVTNENDEFESVYSLDEFLKNERVTYLKADIESYELDMLLGAENIIRNQLPLIAVCIYHNATDMFRIPSFLKSLSPKYKFAIRHHGVGYDDTVLYAWTE